VQNGLCGQQEQGQIKRGKDVDRGSYFISREERKEGGGPVMSKKRKRHQRPRESRTVERGKSTTPEVDRSNLHCREGKIPEGAVGKKRYRKRTETGPRSIPTDEKRGGGIFGCLGRIPDAGGEAIITGAARGIKILRFGTGGGCYIGWSRRK